MSTKEDEFLKQLRATFRIEAEGLVAGEPRARVVAIVQRRAVPGGPGGSTSSVAVLSWRPGER